MTENQAQCPNCRGTFLRQSTDKATGLEIDYCPRCWGLWFDAKELGRFLKSEPLKKKFLWCDAIQPLRRHVEIITPRMCPRCDRPLKETKFDRVVIDICDDCTGIWLDEGELQAILEKFRKGKGGDATVTEELRNGLASGGALDLGALFSSIADLFRPAGK